MWQNYGDATLVSANIIEENEQIEGTNVITDTAVSTDENTVQTANLVDDDTYFTTSKLERENMYSQMLESYQQIYNNTETSGQQKISSLEEIGKINKVKNAIMIAENLISAKGFEKVIIFVNDNSVSVIVGKEELKTEEIAQIQNIVSRELSVDAGIIHISTK